MDKLNYGADVCIDSDSLDVEWLDQPSLMLKYARHEADMLNEYDRAKENLETIKAELDQDIRSNQEKYGIDKITDKVVENTIPLIDEYKEANRTFLKAKHEYNIAKAAVKAIDQRKDSLENLVRLHGQQYFAGPKVPRDLTAKRREKDESDKKGNAVIAQGMQRTKRSL